MSIGVARWVPGLDEARRYERRWLTRDIVAGLVLTGLVAPAGVAYAVASGLPPQHGLYATIVPLLAYAVLGPSRIMVMGPDSSLTPLIAAVVLPVAATDPRQATALAAILAVVAGAMCIALGIARLGFIPDLLASPVRIGYLHGIALTIVVGQLGTWCGFSTSGETILGQLRGFTTGIEEGRFNAWAFGVGASSLVLIVVLRRVSRAVPATLIAVVAGIVVTATVDLEERGVDVVGALPRGLPAPAWPDVGWSTVTTLLGAAAGIAFVAVADTTTLSRAYAVRRRTPVDNDRELVALGVANIASGLFRGFPVSASASRTPVAEASGARTQLTGVVAAVAVLVVAIAAPSTFRFLPSASLAAIVLAAALTLIDVPRLVQLLRQRPSEFGLTMVSMLAVAVLGPITGVAAAISLSVVNFLRHQWKPHTAELVRVDGVKGYHDRERHPEGRVVPGLLLYRFDGPLFFANARYFRDDLLRRIAERTDDVRCVIVTAEPITDVDVTAAETLREVIDELADRGIDVRVAELKGTVRDKVDRYRVFHDRLSAHTARTTGEAVKTYVHDHGVPWVDWEDRHHTPPPSQQAPPDDAGETSHGGDHR